MIVIDESVASVIRQTGEQDYPNETCGFILGKVLEDGNRTGAKALPVENSFEADETYHRFEINPMDFLKAEREAARADMDVIGVYHSHPDHPAKPSAYDLDHAIPFYSYIIVSVEKGKSTDIASYRLKDDRSAFDIEEIIVSD